MVNKLINSNSYKNKLNFNPYKLLSFNQKFQSIRQISTKKMSIAPLILDPVPTLPGLDLKASPLEYFKLATAEYLSKTLDITLEFAYSAVESGKTGKGAVGDLAIALPKFRLKTDPKANVAKVLDNVSSLAVLSLT